MDKSFVSMEQKLCVVCGETFDTGAILMDLRLRLSMDKKTVTGWSMCPRDLAKRDAGYIAMVVVKNTGEHGRINPEDAIREGKIIHIGSEAFRHIFNVPVPDGGVCFIDEDAARSIASLLGDHGRPNQ